MTKPFRQKLAVVALLATALTVIHFIHVFWIKDLSQYGVLPRSLEAWDHIFWSPFIHGSFAHLLNNLVGLGIFSGLLCLLRSLKYYLTASVFIIVVSGILVWAFARTALHFGASGWVFGLWSLLIAQAYFDRSFKNFAIASVVVLFYGGMIFGVLPGQTGISFEAHFFGAVAGALFAALSAKTKRTKQTDVIGLD